MNILFTPLYGIFYDTFKRALKSKMAISLDAQFENFEMPKMAKGFKMKPTPSNIVLGTDEAIIKFKELAKYKKILSIAKNKSKSLHTLEICIQKINEKIWKQFMDTKIIYRGMGISEFSTISKMNRVVGLHHRAKYASINNFVSCSIDADVAASFAIQRKKNGLLVKMDVSQMKKSDYAQVTYEARRDILVTRRGKHAFSPYEMFGGTKAGTFMRECEIQLRNGSSPIIVSAEIFGRRSLDFLEKLNVASKTLEATQGQKIMIKYNNE